MITIFTPSYNREKELKILYNSLLKQNYNDFEWLIVDDGSSDNTKKYIASLKKENKIKINYVYKENGGKQSAYNKGLEETKGDIFLCIDSDDCLKENILKTIADDFKKISSKKSVSRANSNKVKCVLRFTLTTNCTNTICVCFETSRVTKLDDLGFKFSSKLAIS